MKKNIPLVIILVILFISVIFIGYLYLFSFGGLYFMKLDYRINKAVSKNNLKLCDEFGDEKGMEYGYLKDRCYRLIAEKTKDVSTCDKIIIRPGQDPEDDDHKDTCYRNLANDKSDPSICDKMISASNKEFCKSDLK